MSDDSSEYEFLFRPQIRGRSRQADGYGGPRYRASLLSKVRTVARRSGAASARRAWARYDVGETPSNSRRCVVKSHYVSMLRGGRGAAGLHLAYLERDGVERDGSPGRLYGANDTFDREAFAAPLESEKRQFRFIVSPEDARQIDLAMFARELLAQMEKDLERPLVWAAVNHHNTDHPHVHIVIRGVDGDGKELRIPPRYIQHDMRARAQHLLTRELGLRTDIEITRQRSQEIDQERLTSIDRTLAELLMPADDALDRRREFGRLQEAISGRVAGNQLVEALDDVVPDSELRQVTLPPFDYPPAHAHRAAARALVHLSLILRIPQAIRRVSQRRWMKPHPPLRISGSIALRLLPWPWSPRARRAPWRSRVPRWARPDQRPRPPPRRCLSTVG
jgi:hypothetical protein